jgi:hypothetical protein
MACVLHIHAVLLRIGMTQVTEAQPSVVEYTGVH